MGKFNREAYRRVREYSKLTQAEIAQILTDHYGLNTTVDTVKSWTRNGKPSEPETNRMRALAKIFNVPMSTFDNDLENDVKKALKSVIGHQEDKTIQLQIIYAGAGAEAFYDGTSIEHIHINKNLLPNIMGTLITKNTMAIRVIGDSMQPKINENDVLFVDMVNGREFIKADSIYLVRYGDAIQIKQVQFLGDGSINLISLNQTYPIMNEKDDWEILGKPFMKWGVEYFSGLEIQ